MHSILLECLIAITILSYTVACQKTPKTELPIDLYRKLYIMSKIPQVEIDLINNQMREIKFRVYTEVSNEVLGMEYFDLKNTSRRNNTIMQYTWLKDKNWKEIYEGDIVKWNNTKKDVFHIVEYKSYQDSWWYLDVKILWFEDVSFWEVVWNIYENKELLDY